MKKNLFGAVSVALALALAITSFGCESGNDDPVMLATDLDNPVTAGSKFVYAVAPTIYEALGTPTVNEADTKKGYVSDVLKGYEYKKFVDGEKNYNIIDGKWGKASVDSPKTGDVIETKLATVTLDDETKTWTVDGLETSWKVQQILWTNELVSANAPAYIKLPRASSTEDWDDALARYKSDAAVAAAEVEVAEEEVAAKALAYDNAYDALDADAKAAWNALDDDGKEGSVPAALTAIQTAYLNLKAAKEDLETAQEGAAQDLLVYLVAPYYHQGAEYAITATATVNGVTTTSVTFYEAKSNGKINLDKVIYTSSSEAGEATTLGGSYEITGSYKDGEVLITSISDGKTVIEFNDEKDKYTVDGFLMDAETISHDFPNAYVHATSEPARKGTTYSKKGRTLKLAGGVLTSQKIVVDNSTGNEKVDYFLGAVANTPKRAVDQALLDDDHYVNNKLAAQSYTLVQ